MLLFRLGIVMGNPSASPLTTGAGGHLAHALTPGSAPASVGQALCRGDFFLPIDKSKVRS